MNVVIMSSTNLSSSRPMPCISEIKHKVKHSCEITSLVTKEMPQSLCSFPTGTNTQTSLLKAKDYAFSPTPTKQSMHKSTTLGSKNMAEFPPVEIGTRGTVASLIMQEIEYFSRVDSNSQRNKFQITEVGSSISSTSSRTTIVTTVESTKKKRLQEPEV
ncbi:unnamed protein product [Sphenostylis stenocarpa]|uniref:Uncharacterized protein n=1 Tax=Sphenostylis stenocarpa TaxID=92480 RepID=A0AA86VK47_9FABA|nr:unnamed protein product [Sphenostylis stenocarpa]